MTEKVTPAIFVSAALLLTGIGMAGVAHGYGLGTLDYFGAGAFPFYLGLILAGLAALDLAVRLRSPHQGDAGEPVNWPRLLCICGSLGVFALLLDPFGFVPAIFGAALVAMLADIRQRPLATLGFVLGLTLLCYLVFILGLGLPIPAFR
ncbi:tripartite tricarboxylate transporter TctB family protein [Maritimibacter alkaliphilus]|uniref:tripartite tricarboxylate transporter TctB family protein n=1 Tax=Maritimibacter alkaliphilus TaxID=404236 RepID=UPI001C93C276|nr:tripartite tricarboxylate transporter TctB family protein [Maritimibacter alkaliphilus]MBY6092306.1 tripartite tricarboxylate transporter TctB family protein [Maritimibacter alkaliphilus]